MNIFSLQSIVLQILIEEFLFRPASRSRSKSGSPNYAKRNGGGGAAGSTGRRASRSPDDN